MPHAPDDPLATYAPDLFAGQTVLVTGGGTGIGRATALAFARFGADLVVAGRRPQPLAQTAAEIVRRHGGRPRACTVDIRDVGSVEALRDTMLADGGRVDVLVNNAGGQFPALPSQISDNGWRAVVDLNLNGTWNMVSRFMPTMKAQGAGSIVTMVHTYAFERGARLFVHSGAARAGVVSMTRTLASFLAPHGVTVNAIAPGIVDTAGMREYEGDAVDVDALAELGLHSTRRMGSVDEVAAGILWLASPAARYVTGTVLVADGGLMLDNWPDPWDRDAV